jgi:hypothetical protein
MTRKTLLTLTAAALISGTIFAAPVTQYLKMTVTDNSNVAVQQNLSHTFSFSSLGADAADANDMGNQNSISLLGNDVYPFSVTNDGYFITQTDARPDLTGYKKIQFGFVSKLPATIKVLASAFGSIPTDDTNRPTYAWIEQISTGAIYYFLGDTAKIEIPANLNFTADFYLHTGPYISTQVHDENCFGAYDGDLSVSNPNCYGWNLTIFKNAVPFFSDSIHQPDTTLFNLSAGTYTILTYINSIPVDSVELIIYSDPQLIADFTIDNSTPTTNDVVNFTNISVAPSSASFYWTLGDGNDDINTNTSNHYYLPGAYEIVLTVISATGCQATVFDSVWVTAFSSGGDENVMEQVSNFNQVINNNSITSTGSRNEVFEISTPESQRIMITQTESQMMNIMITNVSGQIISTTQTADAKITLDVPATGIYIVRIENAKKDVLVKTIMVAN